MRLGVDYKKSDQTVRGTVSLPHGTGRTVRVIVFAAGAQADAAREAGADEAGYDELIEKVRGGWTEFDVAIATTDAMKEVRKLGRVIREDRCRTPRLTITDDAPAVTAAKGAANEFRIPAQATSAAAASGFEAQKENILIIERQPRASAAAGTLSAVAPLVRP